MKKISLLLLAVAGLAFASCRKDDIPKPPADKERTFFLYIAADNSLGLSGYTFDYKNIESLLKGVRKEHLLTSNIVIYHDPKIAVNGRKDALPRLLEVVADSKGTITTKEVKAYEEQNSASAENLSARLAEMQELYPAKRYGFLMWSHGSGWLPPNPLYKPESRAIGQDDRDGNNWMDVHDFAAAIPDGLFDYILFDACSMAGVEIAYLLRDKTDYILAAPTEIMGEGMPYELMPDYLLRESPDYTDFCDAFYDYYDSAYGSTISLIATYQMETLAGLVEEILQNVSMEQIHAIPDKDLQWFDRLSVFPYHMFFDLGDYMRQVASVSQYAEFENLMKEVVPYYRHSDSFLDGHGGFKIRSYSGLCTYVPRSTPNLERIGDYYETLDWYKAVYD